MKIGRAVENLPVRIVGGSRSRSIYAPVMQKMRKVMNSKNPYVHLICDDRNERDKVSTCLYQLYSKKCKAEGLKLRTKRDPNGERDLYVWLENRS